MSIENLIKIGEQEIGYKWDMDGFHESNTAFPFGTLVCSTKAYRFSVSERGIWANEKIVIKTGDFSFSKNVEMFEKMLSNSISKFDKYIPSEHFWLNH
jgi:hypothetical protein